MAYLFLMMVLLLCGTRRSLSWRLSIVNVEWLVHRVLPIEAHKANHIKALIVLLKSTLQPGNLGRLACGICDLIQNLIPPQALFHNVGIMVGHVEVAPELTPWMVVIDILELCIDPFIESTEHHCQR